MVKHAMAALVAVALSVPFDFAAQADLQVVTFESDPAGPVPDGFVSADSPLVSFTNSFGLGLAIGDYGPASNGQGLAVGDNDSSFLIMNFTTIMDFISLDFGNDDPLLTAPGDYALLTTYLGGLEVDQTLVLLNRDGIMNQTISLGGSQFDSASLEYYVSSDGVTKVVDNIAFNTVPAPAVLPLLAAAGFLSRRRRGA